MGVLYSVIGVFLGSSALAGDASTFLNPFNFEGVKTEEHPIKRCLRVWKDVKSKDAEISGVADGDTVKVKTDDGVFSIRLLSIDTLETKYQGKNQGYWAKFASDRMKNVATVGSKVSVELDQAACDGYGRVLGYVWMGKKMLNEQMLSEGLAVNYCIYPNDRYCKDFADISAANIKAEKGIFKDYKRKKIELPYEWRRQISNRPYEKYVGNIDTWLVRKPDEVVKVPVAQRVFFMKASDVHAPYKFEDEEEDFLEDQI